MLDIKFVRDNPDIVKQNIKNKFQEAKLPLVDQVLALDKENRDAITRASELRAQRNTPVSYTHLDVYKRQPELGGADGLSPR